ncbi:hypothetical protein ABMA28_012697 [Loxostege sticticalis]|uniref:Uncharacterized protein n=1 Tax=Loxostege sticticalis TaxID=481309 RepID=A0ABD0S4Q0_LOXSC
MANMQVCRVCLAHDMPMCSINNTMLQEFYEKNTNKPFNTKDGRLSMVCYICYHLLKKCHRFFESAVKANEVLQEMYDSKTQLSVTLISRSSIQCGYTIVYKYAPDNTPIVMVSDSDAFNRMTVYGDAHETGDSDTERSPYCLTVAVAIARLINWDTYSQALCDVTLSGPLDSPESVEAATEYIMERLSQALINTKNNTVSLMIRKERKRYVCNRCGKIVDNKSDLIAHFTKHTHKKTYVCHFCGKSCKSKPALKEHVRIHTGEKPFECDYCNKKFTQKSTVVKHLRMHTGEKPYTCDYCGVKISQLSNLRMHLKRHTGEKPFTCSYCQKSFPRKNHLTEHLRLHTGEMPFACVYCDKKFQQKRYLNRHVKAHSETKNTDAMVSGPKETDRVAACLQ